MYPPAVTTCQTARSTTTESVPSARERDVPSRRKRRRRARALSAVAAPGARAVATRPRMLLRRHQVSPEPLARVRLGVDVLGVVGPVDHQIDGTQQLVDVLLLLARVEVRELLHARLDPVRAPLEPLVGRDRRLP